MKKILCFGILLILVIGLVACKAEEPAKMEETPKTDVVMQEPEQPADSIEETAIDRDTAEFPLLLNVGEEVNIDLDGDGTVERVLVEIVEDDLGWNQHVVTINGINQMEALGLYSDNPDTDYYAITDLDADDKWLEIALPNQGPSHDPSTTFLRYESGTLSSLGEVYGMVSEDHLTFDGAGIVSSFMRLSVLQTWYAPVQWSIGEEGVLEDIPQDLYYPFASSYAPVKTALKELAGYADRDSALRICIEIGTKIEFLATDNICWVQCEDETGSEFWLHLNEENGHQVELFDGSYSWDGIEGLSMAD